MRVEERDAAGMVQYYWSAIVGTERSIGFAALMRQEGFSRFEEALEEFRVRFDNDFLAKIIKDPFLRRRPRVTDKPGFGLMECRPARATSGAHIKILCCTYGVHNFFSTFAQRFPNL